MSSNLSSVDPVPHAGSVFLSAIIPVWREAGIIAETVARARRIADEVIVVDADSPDGTAEQAREAGATVLRCEKGRGAQLDTGARAAAGEVLLFLHADAVLDPAARELLQRAMQDSKIIGGNFLLSFGSASAWARFFSWANDVRRRWLRIYYGDSAIFVRRSAYATVGGFRSIPVFEDYDFVRRLELAGRTCYVRSAVVNVSSRRFEQRAARTLIQWTLLQLLYSAGVHPKHLARLYGDAR